MAIEPEQIERAVAGDSAALEAMLLDAMPQLRAKLSVGDAWNRAFDVEDILQVTSLEAFLRIGTLEQRSSGGFVTWLRRIAENNLRDALRGLEAAKRPRAADRRTHGVAGESSRTLLAAVAGEHATAGGRAALAEELQRMEQAIRTLPRSYREVLREVDLAERPVADVAAAMDRSEGAVHMLRSRARERLRELLTRPG